MTEGFLMQRWKHQHVSIRNVLRQFGSTWMGTVTKSIVISRLLKTPLHYVQFCSLKWSGILTCFFTTSSWCSTWSHGRSFMTIIPCWQEDHGKVDQASQTKWLFQKRLNREKKKTSSVVSRINETSGEKRNSVPQCSWKWRST